MQWLEILICSWNSTKSVLSGFFKLFFSILLLSVPSQSPPNTVVKSTSSSTIDVSWDAIEDSYVHGILLGYEVRYTKDDGSTHAWQTITLDSSTFTMTLSDLEYFTRYKVVVCARTSKGCGKGYSATSYTWGDGKYSSVYILQASYSIKADSCFLFILLLLWIFVIWPFNGYLWVSYRLGSVLKMIFGTVTNLS